MLVATVWIPDFMGIGFLTPDGEFRIAISSRFPVSLSCIHDFNPQDTEFHKQEESGFPYRRGVFQSSYSAPSFGCHSVLVEQCTDRIPKGRRVYGCHLCLTLTWQKGHSV